MAVQQMLDENRQSEIECVAEWGLSRIENMGQFSSYNFKLLQREFLDELDKRKVEYSIEKEEIPTLENYVLEAIPYYMCDDWSAAFRKNPPATLDQLWDLMKSLC